MNINLERVISESNLLDLQNTALLDGTEIDAVKTPQRS